LDLCLADPIRRQLKRNDRQAINASEIAVARDQCRAESERRRGHPEIVFVQGEATLLPSQLNGRVKVACPFRDRFAAHGAQKLATGLFQLGAPPASRKSCKPKEYFASNDRTGNHAVALVQPGHPVLDWRRRSHQIANRVVSRR
jgi:hypothetical protein